MKSLPFLAACASVALLSATPVAAQDRDPQASLGEFFAPDRIAMIFANAGIEALRTRMELRYDHLSADPMRGSVAISGIVARPLLPYDQAGQCEITVERATLDSAFFDPFQSTAAVNLNVIGARASLACVPRDITLALRTAGYRDLPLDQFKISADYTYTTGEISVDSTVAINGLAILDYSASGTLLPRLNQFGRSDTPALRVSGAVATLKDDGGWAALSQIIPENLRDPATISELGNEAVTQFLTDGGLRPMGAAERKFVNELMAQVETFVADPGEITIEADLPRGGIVIEPDTYESPQSLIAALGLRARSTPLVRSRILPADMLAGLRAPEDLTPDARLALAAALLEGDGVPYSPPMVTDLLMSLLDQPENAGQAAALLARAVADTDVPRAYGYMLIASGSDTVPGSVAQLDRLEAQMRTQDVLAAQDAYLTRSNAPDPISLVDGDDPRDLRRLALAHFTGNGAVRSYARAYYYALLAEAAGDIAATSLRTDIAARFVARGPDVAQAWHRIAADMQARAMTDWIAADLPSVYVTQN